jgi:hypothetical protein
MVFRSLQRLLLGSMLGRRVNSFVEADMMHLLEDLDAPQPMSARRGVRLDGH